MNVLVVGVGPPDPAALDAAATALRAGEVVGVPTDTVYGLAVDPGVPGASQRIFVAKARPRRVRLPVLVAGADQALDLADRPTPVARRLMARLWPGPVTVVVGCRPGTDLDLGGDDAGGGEAGGGAGAGEAGGGEAGVGETGTAPRTVGLRCPAHPVPVALCLAVGPLATTSANVHGQPPATTADSFARLPGVSLVLDSGVCDGELSTVVDCTEAAPRLLRLGAVAWERILDASRP